MKRRRESGLLRVVAAGWLAVIALGLAVGASGSAWARAAVLDDGPGCIWKMVTGVDCPFCGMTHATVALGAGDWTAAHRAHPLALIVLAGQALACGLIASGRADALVRGRRPLFILGAVAALWALRLAL